MSWEQLNRVLVKLNMDREDWRRSENFAISAPPPFNKLRWTILTEGQKDARFSVARDVTFGADPTLMSNLTSGSTTQVFSEDNLYIGGCFGNTGDFEVLIEGTREKQDL